MINPIAVKNMLEEVSKANKIYGKAWAISNAQYSVLIRSTSDLSRHIPLNGRFKLPQAKILERRAV